MTRLHGPVRERLLEEARAVLKRVNSHTDPQILLEDLENHTQVHDSAGASWPLDHEGALLPEVSEALIRAAYATRPYCVRCGVCCTLGSPTLTEADEDLLFNGALRFSDLITLRKGETAYSAVTRSAAPLEREMIKIREQPGTKTCVFHDPEKSGCGIYETRPVQCRAQKCWDPESYAKTTAGPPLDRARVLRSAGIIREIVSRHEARCGRETFSRVMARLAATKGRSVADAVDMLAFDDHVRKFVMEKLGVADRELDFYFGRSLIEALEPYGLKVLAEADGSFRLAPVDD